MRVDLNTKSGLFREAVDRMNGRKNPIREHVERMLDNPEIMEASRQDVDMDPQLRELRKRLPEGFGFVELMIPMDWDIYMFYTGVFPRVEVQEIVLNEFYLPAIHVLQEIVVAIPYPPMGGMEDIDPDWVVLQYYRNHVQAYRLCINPVEVYRVLEKPTPMGSLQRCPFNDYWRTCLN